jgi:hypothetical protein
MKTRMNLQNPKRFPELLLFFGMVLVFFGSGVEAITSNPTLANDGWIVVIASIFLWAFKESKGRNTY